MKATRVMRRTWARYIAKGFNLSVIIMLVLQPVGAPGLLGVFSLAPLTAVAQETGAIEQALDQTQSTEASAPVEKPEEVTATEEEAEPADNPITEVPADEPAVEESAPVEAPVEEGSDTSEPAVEETAVDTPTDTPVETPVDTEAEPMEEPAVTEETLEESPESPATTEEPAPVEETAVAEEILITPIEAPSVKPVEETVCLSASVTESAEGAWKVNGEKAETTSVVELGTRYVFPLDEEVSVTFTCLPTDLSKRAPLSIERIKASDLELPAGTVAVSEYAYDIETEGMENGSFKYDLTLPKFEGVKNADISYIEISADEVKGKNLSDADVKKVDEEKVDNKSGSVAVEGLDHFTPFVATQASLVSAQQTTTGVCMEDATGGNLQCTANDVSIASVTGIQILDDGCAFPGDTVTFQATWNVQSGANQRYDVGLYFATAGQTSALNGQCSVSTLANAPVPPWFDFDGDACGDIAQNTTLQPQITLTATCADPDGDNNLNLPYCTSWDNNQNGVCNGPANALPGTGSKCNCQDGFEVPVTVPFFAKIEAIKELTPTTDTGKFNLQIDGSTETANAGHAGTTGQVSVTAGTNQAPGATHTVGETAGTGTSLSDYTASISCVDRGLTTFNGGAPLTLASAGPLNVPVDKDDDVVCTITNTRQAGTIVIVKDSVPNDAQDFAFTTTGTGLSSFSLDDDADGTLSDTKTFIGILPGSYTVTETASAGFDLTGLNCVDPTQNSTSDLGTRTATINLVANETVTCTFTNTQRGKIIVDKVTNPAGDSQSFTFTPSYGSQFSLTDSATPNDSGFLVPGTYSVSESIPTGWTQTSTTCSDQSPVGAISLQAGETVTCTFTNAKDPVLTLQKTVVNDNGGTAVDTDWMLSASGPTPISGVEGNASVTNAVVSSGSYTLSESGGPAGYAATQYSCVKNGGGAVVSNSIALASGDVATCTIMNDDQAPSLTLVKVVENNNNIGTTLPTAWTLTATGAGQNPTNLSGTMPVVSGTTFKADTYTLAESSGPVGYTASLWTCTNDVTVTNGQIILTNGQSTTCTITNTRDTGTLQVLKNVDLNGDGDYADQEETGATNWLWQLNGGSDHNTGDPAMTVGTGNYALTETAQTNFHFVSLTCEGGALNGNTVTIAKDANVVCTFTNARDTGRLKAVKVVDDGSDITQWSFSLDGGNAIPANAQGEVDFGQVTTSVTHTITESGPTGSYALQSVSGANCSRVGDTLSANATVAKDGTTVCTFSNVVNKGTITIIKNALPDDVQDFAFTTTGNGLSSFALDDDADGTLSNSQTFVNLFPGTYTVTESTTGGWDLTGLNCVDPTQNSNANLESRTANIDVAAGETVTCTYTNTKRGNIIVEKQTNPDGAAGGFTFTGDVAGTVSDDGQIVVNNVVPGTYASTESNPGPDFVLTGLVCDDGQSTTPSTIDLGSRTATFKVDPGETVKCTFTNTKQGGLTIVKNTVGGDGTFNFITTGGLSPANPSIVTSNNTGSQAYPNVVPGNYSVTETVPAGWDLTGSVCVSSNSDNETPGAITLSAGESVTCTFTNAKRGSITIVKDAINNNAQDFTFHNNFGNNHPSSFLLDDDGNNGNVLPNTRTFEVIPGTYAVSEGAVAGWQQESATCDSGETIESIDVNPGETVTCTFVNEELATIVLVKNTVGGDATFDFDATGAGLPADISLTTVSGTASQTFSGLDQDNAYSLAENIPTGWDLTSAVCDRGETPDDIDIEPGETVTCTFTNTKRGTIIVEKQTNPDGNKQVFEFNPSWSEDNFFLSDGLQVNSGFLAPGTYSVAELTPTGWDLTNVACQSSLGGQEDYIEILLTAGETVTCTFTNTQRGKIIVEKQTNPSESQQAFSFDPSWSTDNFSLVDNGQQDSGWLVPGTYSVAELGQAGWDLTNVACLSSLGGQEDYIEILLTAGETVTCTFTNTQRGKIIVEKQTDPDGDQTDFGFNASYDQDGFSLADGEQNDSGPLIPGLYTVSENVPAGWKLSGVTCVYDGESVGVAIENGKQVQLGAGDTVTCTFTNTEEVKVVCGDGLLNQESEQCDGTAGVTPGVNFCTFSCKLVPIYDGEGVCSKGKEPVLITSKFVPGTAPDGLTPTALSLTGGKEYLIEATGTYSYGGIVPSNLLNRADAGYSSDDNFAGPSLLNSLFGISAGATYRGIHTLISDWGTGVYGVVDWGTYDSTHVYPVNVAPAANTNVNFLISDWYDTWYSGDGLSDTNKEQAGYRDNEGGLTLNLYECQEPRRGSITVMKDAVPNHEQNFGFVLNPGFVEFVLDDDSDPLLSNSFTQSDLAAGIYSVTEGLVPGWTLESVTCTSNQRSLLPTTDPVRTIDLAPGENVTCVFANRANNGSITIIKDALPDDPQNFGYAMNGAGFVEFVLDDDSDPLLSNTATFTSLMPGAYTVTEGLVPGWLLENVSCVSNQKEFADSTEPIRTIELGIGETVTCTFLNRMEEKVPVCGDGLLNQESEQCDGTAGVTPGVNFCTFSCKLVPIYDGGDACSEGRERIKVASYFVESFMTEGVIPAPIVVPLQGGREYLLEATGDFGYGGVPENNALNRADAAYATDTNWAGPNLDSLFGTPASALYRGIHTLISDFGTGTFGVMNWGAYVPSHVYTMGVNPASNANVQFAISDWYDTWYTGGPWADFNQNQFGFRDNEGGITLNLYECVEDEEPRLEILKVNNRFPEVQEPGALVTYTITVMAPETNGGPIDDVTVTDLPPDGFEYVAGSALASQGSLSSPYASPGVWSLGTLSPGQSVTLSYDAVISEDQGDGLYRDLAWARGIAGEETVVLASDIANEHESVDPTNPTGDNYVGTRISVASPESTVVALNVRTERDVDTDTVRRVKRVLGAALPETGADTNWLMLALAFLGVGTGLIVWSRRRRKTLAAISLKVLAMFVLGGAMLVGGVNAANAASPAVKVEIPDSPVAMPSVDIGFVTLDIEGRLLDATCHQASGPAATVNTVYTVKAGGNSGKCAAVLTADGNYQFFVRVSYDTSSSVDSDTVSIQLLSSFPSTPVSYSRSACTVSFVTANDGLTTAVELHRATTTNFVASAATKVAEVAVAPNTAGAIVDPSVDCGSGYYYAIRALAGNGNGSGFIGDEGVTIDKENKVKYETDTKRIPGPRATRAITVTGAGAASGAATGAVEGAATTDEAGAVENGKSTGAVLGDETAVVEGVDEAGGFINWIKEHPWQSTIAVLILVALGYYGYARRRTGFDTP